MPTSSLLPSWLKVFLAVVEQGSFNRAAEVLLLSQPAVSQKIRQLEASLVAQVARHALPLAIIEGELPAETEVAYVLLREIPFVIVTPATPPWVEKKRLPLQALDGVAFVTRTADSQTRRWIDRLLAQAGARPRVVAELDSPAAIKEAVAREMGVALLPDCVVEETTGLHLIQIENEVPKRYLKAVWAKDIPLHPLAVAFLETLQDTFPTVQPILRDVRKPDWETLYALLGAEPFSPGERS